MGSAVACFRLIRLVWGCCFVRLTISYRGQVPAFYMVQKCWPVHLMTDRPREISLIFPLFFFLRIWVLDAPPVASCCLHVDMHGFRLLLFICWCCFQQVKALGKAFNLVPGPVCCLGFVSKKKQPWSPSPFLLPFASVLMARFG